MIHFEFPPSVCGTAYGLVSGLLQQSRWQHGLKPIQMTPNDRRQRRAGTMPAKKDDADRRVRCTPRLGGSRSPFA
jgi:hypothetical protein